MVGKVWLGVVLVLALGGCGSEVAPGSALGNKSSPRPAWKTPGGDLVPQAQPTQAFVERAGVVAQAVRAAGIPAPVTGIFLYSTRTPGLGFDTGQQKISWSSGRVAFADGVQFAAGDTTRVDFADGSNETMQVLEAQQALTEAIGPPNDMCERMPSCETLTITAGSLTTTDVETSHGQATVPAWSFTVQGLSRPVVAVAVPADVLKSLQWRDPLPGLARLEQGLLRVGVLDWVDGKTLSFEFSHGLYETDLRAHVVEYDDLVVIGGSHGPLLPGGADVGKTSTAVVTLGKPLGDRAVIAADTGVRLTPYPYLRN